MDEKLFAELKISLRQAATICAGTAQPARSARMKSSRVLGLRTRLGLSQAQFAALLQVSIRTLQNWEQQRREPAGPAQALIQLVDKEPEAALRALQPLDRKTRSR